MFSPRGTNEYTKSEWDNIRKAAEAIKNADRVVIGIGSGMTAAGGLCYTDAALAEKWYPEYFALGKRSIIEIMSGYWPTTISKKNAAAFWSFWARHIWHIRYEAEALQTYRDLFSIMKDKDYFVCSTNVDGQLEKAGFVKERIFAPQGDYALLQCEKPCSKDVYDNRVMVEEMIAHMPNSFEIRTEDIPHCPRCGANLMPNLRADHRFVEGPHMENVLRYQMFLDEASEKKLVLLELGVGFNTPGIIRYPFEHMASISRHAVLIRINRDNASIPEAVTKRSLGLRVDLKDALYEMYLSLQ